MSKEDNQAAAEYLQKIQQLKAQIQDNEEYEYDEEEVIPDKTGPEVVIHEASPEKEE